LSGLAQPRLTKDGQPYLDARDRPRPGPRKFSCPQLILRFPVSLWVGVFIPPPATPGRHPPPENRFGYVVTRSRPYPLLHPVLTCVPNRQPLTAITQFDSHQIW